MSIATVGRKKNKERNNGERQDASTVQAAEYGSVSIGRKALTMNHDEYRLT